MWWAGAKCVCVCALPCPGSLPPPRLLHLVTYTHIIYLVAARSFPAHMPERRSRSVPKRRLPIRATPKSVNFTGVEDVADSVSLRYPKPKPLHSIKEAHQDASSPRVSRGIHCSRKLQQGIFSKAASALIFQIDAALQLQNRRVSADRAEQLQDQKEAEQKELELELIPFVIKVQRAFRMVKFVYKKFGPMLFLDSKWRAPYGQIVCEVRAGEMDLVYASRVGAKTREDDGLLLGASQARRSLHHRSAHASSTRGLSLQHARSAAAVLVTVTGGAQDFDDADCTWPRSRH